MLQCSVERKLFDCFFMASKRSHFTFIAFNTWISCLYFFPSYWGLWGKGSSGEGVDIIIFFILQLLWRMMQPICKLIKLNLCLFWILFWTVLCRTPDLCALQQDNSDHLDAVGAILYDVTGVNSAHQNLLFEILSFHETMINLRFGI